MPTPAPARPPITPRLPPLGFTLSLTLAGLSACAGDASEVGVIRAELGERCVSIIEGVAGGAVDDTYVSSRRPNRNFDDHRLVSGDDDGGTAITLVRADLSSVPSGAHVQLATLGLRQGTRDGLVRVGAHRVTAAWAEGGVTWTTFSGAYAADAEHSLWAGGRGASNVFDLTALVQRWVDGAVANHGVAVLADSYIVHASHRAPLPRRPVVTVCYTTCADGLQNGAETGIDCGGPRCGACTVDADGDGHDAAVDCNDLDSAIHPGAAERCDGVDDDCDGVADQGNPGGGAACATGNPTCAAGVTACVGGVLVCDATVAGAEVCNGADDDCDGVIDDGNPGGFIDCRRTFSANPADPTEVGGWFYGYTSCVAGDVACLAVDTIESCDGIDNDLDGLVDEDAVQCRDADGDESGDPLDQLRGCAPVPGYVFDCHDCDDADVDTGTFSSFLDCGFDEPYADHDCDGTLDRGESDCQ